MTKKFFKVQRTLLLATLLFPFTLIAQPLKGTFTVGNTGTYFSITQAVSDLRLKGVDSAVVFELQSDYNSTNETFPITFPLINGVSELKTITFRPAAAAGFVSINSGTQTLFRFDSAKYVTIDGRAGGTGTGKMLLLGNNGGSNTAISFHSDACFNKLIYDSITVDSAAAISFFYSIVDRGNDSNVVAWNSISSRVNKTRYLIYALGSTAHHFITNTDNVIKGNSFTGFGQVSNDSTRGIFIGTGNNAWVIEDNSFFQQAEISSNNNLCFVGIHLNVGPVSSFIIRNNSIGGSSASCQGQPFRMRSTGITRSLSFLGIHVTSGSTNYDPYIISGNEISNISMEATSTFTFTGIFRSINSYGLSHNDIRNNVIGSADTTKPIIIRNNQASATGNIYGIMLDCQSGGNINLSIKGNTIGNISSFVGSATSTRTNFRGIDVVGEYAYSEIMDNEIGNANPRNIFIERTQDVAGISVSTVSLFFTSNSKISGNLVRNIHVDKPVLNFTKVAGINIQYPGIKVYDNTIHSISSRGNLLVPNMLSSTLCGIMGTNANSDVKVSRNNIYNLYNDSIRNRGAVIGIVISAFNVNGNQPLVNGNIIRDLYVKNATGITSADSFLIAGVHTNYMRTFNNMIRLGFDTAGNAIRAKSAICGIYENSSQGASVAYNSVYIGGDSAEAYPSYAYYSAAPGGGSLSNNILVNNRSSINTNKTYHAGMSLLIKTYFPIRNNLFYTSKPNGAIALYKDTNMITLKDFGRTYGDSNNLFGNPNFVNAEGHGSLMDLHLQNITPAEGKGWTGLTVTHDIDSMSRDSLTPSDIGAHAGNFTAVEANPPVITFEPFSNTGLTGTRILKASITDSSGIFMSTLLKPRIYFKKGIEGTWVSNAGVLDSGNAYHSNWNFHITSTLLGGVTSGDTIFYFVVAQDSSLLKNMAGAPGTDTRTLASFPYRGAYYRIVNAFSGVYNIGTGYTYTSLTNAGGFFDALSKGTVTGNVTLVIKNDLLTESGLYSLNKWVNESAVKNKIAIRPGSAVRKTISGTVSTSLIQINKAEGFTIDGSFNGSGRYLLFRNMHATGRTITLQNGCRLDTVMNCIIEGRNTNAGVSFRGLLSLYSNDLTSNDSILIMNNQIRKDTTSTAIPEYLVYGYTATNMGEHANAIHVINNELSNCKRGFIFVHDNMMIGDWKIYGNNIYQDSGVLAPGVYDMFGFYSLRSKNILVRKNNIGGSGPGITGKMALNNNVYFRGINVSGATINDWTATIDSNNIGAISTLDLLGIIASDFTRAHISHNNIGNTTDANDSLWIGQNFVGIIGEGHDLTQDSIRITNNHISGIAIKTGNPTFAITAIDTREASAEVSYNTAKNISAITPNAGSAFLFLCKGNTTDTMEMNVHHNIIDSVVLVNNQTSAVAMTIENKKGTLLIHHNEVGHFIHGSLDGYLTGLSYISGDHAKIYNNQISVSAPAGGDVRTDGIFGYSVVSNPPPAVHDIFYNTVLISGRTTTTQFSSALYNIYPNAKLYNNILFNRIESINSYSLGFGASFSQGPDFANRFMHNLIVVPDTNNVYCNSSARYGLNNFINRFPSVDHVNRNTSWIEQANNIPAHLLFKDTASNLDINTSNAACWYVNGKGIALADINEDLHGDARHTSVTNGATDIGADEFTPDTGVLPQALNISTSAYGLQAVIFAGRIVARINWLAGGTLPTTAQLRYYSGVAAPSLHPGADHFNAYHDLILSGGNNYAYTIEALYDSSTFGTITSINNIKLATNQGIWKYQGGGLAPVSGLYTHDAGLQFSGSALITGTTAANPLPIKLLNISGIKQNDNVLLNWKTASEINTNIFEIERSYDGKTFEYIGKVKAKGSSGVTTAYTFTDRDAQMDKKIYYRLRIIDNDGKYEYSRTVFIDPVQPSATISIYPNPVVDRFTLQVYSAQQSTIKITLRDITGRTVYTQDALVNKGLKDLEVNMDDFKPGVYFVSAQVNGTTHTIKILKQ